MQKIWKKGAIHIVNGLNKHIFTKSPRIKSLTFATKIRGDKKSALKRKFGANYIENVLFLGVKEGAIPEG